MEQTNKDLDFLEYHKSTLEHSGFWSEEFRESILRAILSRYATHVIREWFISDIVPNADKFLIKWQKRYQPLTDDELKEKYGR